MADDDSPPSTKTDNQNPPSSQPPLKIEPNSPFYLGSQDRPGDFIIPTRLTGENYDDWSANIQTALEARLIFNFLNGTITGPTTPCSQSDWTTINAMLISWLMNTIDPKVKCSLAKYKDARKLWDTPKKRFAVVNGPRIHQLKSSIAKCEQSKNMPVSTYFGQLSVLWEELHTHEPIIECSCCSSCTAGSKHEKRRENGKLHKFLMGLCSEYYAQLRTNILSKDPLPSLDRAYQLVSQDERVRLAKAVDEKPPKVVGFSVHTGSNRGRRHFDLLDKSHLSCTHCKKSGHEVSQCFEIHGYPEWYEDRVKMTGGSGTRGGRTGTGRGRSIARANATVISGTAGM